MKLRTLEELNDHMTEDLAWRKKEISDYFTSIKPASSTSKSLIRGAVAIMYAHWEGHIKHCAKGYLYYVAIRRLKYKDLRSNFLALSIKDMFKEMGINREIEIHLRIVGFFLNEMDNNSKINHKTSIDTESNLSSVVLKNIVYSLGLDYSPFQPKETIINQKLLNKRNNIAHGDYLDVTLSDAIELKDEILALLDNFQTQIYNAAATEAYKL